MTEQNAKPGVVMRPYSWYHPEKSWLDIIFSLTFPLFLPLHSVAKYPPTEDKENAILCMKDLREQGDKLVQRRLKSSASVFRKWGEVAGCPIAEVNYQVPRPTNLLMEWGLTDSVTSQDISPQGNIPVKIFFPVSLLGKEGEISSEISDFGLLPVTLDDLSCLPCDVPLIIGFHGGGLTYGNAYAHDLLDVALKLVEERNKPIIIALEYSLAPEYPFPVAVEEALACVDHFLTKDKSRKVHLFGNSAGGYLATVATMEIFRRNPGRIVSSLLMCPMLDPAADSLSTYLNSTSSFVPGSYHTWCWQAFLELPASKDNVPIGNDSAEENAVTLDARCARDSNRTTWNECKYKGSSVERLIKPIVDLPVGLNGPDAPMIILTSNRADLLYSEGQELADKLKEMSAKITYLDHKGSHSVGTVLDPKACKQLIHAWGVALFDSRQSNAVA